MSIELLNICKSYGEPPKQVLHDLSVTFQEGITCIMGPSGVGKTTLMRIIAGLTSQDSGSIIGLDGKKISLVFQEDRLLEWESALGNVLFVTKASTININQAKALLKQAGLAESMHKKARELSGGMKRRVCLCRALIAEFDLLLLDEPFKGLDAGLKPDIMTMVKEQALKRPEATIICITHDPAEVDFFGARLVTLA